jgi:hypothetical protein
MAPGGKMKNLPDVKYPGELVIMLLFYAVCKQLYAFAFCRFLPELSAADSLL